MTISSTSGQCYLEVENIFVNISAKTKNFLEIFKGVILGTIYYRVLKKTRIQQSHGTTPLIGSKLGVGFEVRKSNGDIYSSVELSLITKFVDFLCLTFYLFRHSQEGGFKLNFDNEKNRKNLILFGNLYYYRKMSFILNLSNRRILLSLTRNPPTVLLLSFLGCCGSIKESVCLLALVRDTF